MAQGYEGEHGKVREGFNRRKGRREISTWGGGGRKNNAKGVKNSQKEYFYLLKLHLLHISIYVYISMHSLNEVSPLMLTYSSHKNH